MNKPLSSRSEGGRSRRALATHTAAAPFGFRPSGFISLCCGLLMIGLTPTLLPAQSLWKDSSAGSIVSDKRAHAVGDIVTILVQESNSASKNNTTSTSKKAALDASISSFLYSPSGSSFLTQNGKMPAIKFDSSHTFDGGGKIDNSEKITARIAVRVTEVLPNGNLVLEGTKKTAFGGETSDAVLHGVVRQEDVSASSTVYSYNVADATIKYVSKGAITDAQRKGWFTRIWEKLTPF
jgi:flagellar L-ring protein FlgH